MTPEPLTLADLPIERFERIERAILGDPDVGQLGVFDRLNRVDEVFLTNDAVHQSMREERIDGDRRVHARVDKVEEELGEKIDGIGKKLDRSIYLSAGAFLGGIGLGSTGWWQSLIGS